MTESATIVIAGWLAIDPAQRDELAALLVEVAAASRAEPGCREYRVSVELDDPNRFRVLEEWASVAELEAHMKTAHVARFLTTLPRLRVQGMAIDRYVATAKRRVV